MTVEKQTNALMNLSDIHTLPHAEKLVRLRKITEYTGSASEKIDQYLNQTLDLLGVVVQPDATVRLDPPKVEPDGTITEFATEDRTIIKFTVRGDKTKTVHFVAFMSKAATGFFDNMVIPFFGVGDFTELVPIKAAQTASKLGRSYNFQFVE